MDLEDNPNNIAFIRPPNYDEYLMALDNWNRKPLIDSKRWK